MAILSCREPATPVDPARHRAEVEAWREARYADLRRPDGWLSLVGLYWLEEGRNAFGSAPGSELLFEGAPDAPVPGRIGVFHVASDGSVVFEVERGVVVRKDGELVDGAVMRAPEATGDAPPPVLAWGPLTWHVMVRGGELAVRLKSADSRVLRGFEGIEHYPVTVEWRLEGRLQPYDPPKSILIPNVLGTDVETGSPGAAVFRVDGETWRLDLWRDSDDPDNYFTAFADATNGDGTYGGGRFLWIDAPDAGDDRIVVDFNRAYNPPCVFTPYATCPLPPPGNRLPFPVPAGEKDWQAH